MTETVGRTGETGSATQLLRFIAVGVASNLAGYLLYLLITHLGVAPKLAMTVLYAVGAVLGFVGNRNYTFGHPSQLLSTWVRYIMTHGVGYLLNLSIQYVAVDRLGYPHQLAQVVGICTVALFLFFAFKFFVFVKRTSLAAESR